MRFSVYIVWTSVASFNNLKLHNIKAIEVTSWLASADDFSSRVARGANERVSSATPRNE